MYKIKELAKRGTALLGAAGMLAGIGTTALPAFVSADALNPLTERSLTLSSSSPGWSFYDGSGNTTYAPPNSGANGQKTGNTFTFKASSSEIVRAFSFQYCTTPAGFCYSPGDNGYNLQGTPGVAGDDTRNADSAATSDLEVVDATPTEISAGDWTTIQARHSGVTPGEYAKTPLADNSEGNFVVLVNGTPDSGWTMTAGTSEYTTVQTRTIGTDSPTGKKNYITLTKSAGRNLTPADSVKIVFFATTTNYIKNPGGGAFFVKINTYDSSGTLDDNTLVDGGVTVANVMNESISIQTKVLETMDFSVGVKDPNTYADSVLTARGIPAHGQCSALLMADPLAAGVTDSTTYNAQPHNVLKLGDSSAEYSLKTGVAHDVYSYWRLSSNSSGGATVYYTGHTLTNTVGDEITPLNDTTAGGTSSITGTEQFGLGIAHDGTADYAVSGDTYGSSGTPGDFANYLTGDAKAHSPKLAPLVPSTNYGGGTGTITSSGSAKFAFNADADSYAVPIATETTEVVDCVTAKMRYVANIAATTPAGIYTTKINYVASPQY